MTPRTPTIRTYSIQTLGCKVNQYEAEQLATLLRARGLRPATDGAAADLRVVHTCSVTVQAASKSRQTVRQAVGAGQGGRALPALALPVLPSGPGQSPWAPSSSDTGRVVVSGCWATSDPQAAAALPGVDAVLTHHGDVAADLDALLDRWLTESTGASADDATLDHQTDCRSSAAPDFVRDDSWDTSAGTAAGHFSRISKLPPTPGVNAKIEADATLRRRDGSADFGPSLDGTAPHRHDAVPTSGPPRRGIIGTSTLPLLHDHQTGRQRALLKVQDGCDAHCTYCIIPKLRPGVRSKPVDDAVAEAARLVAGGHVELVLTGIFLGAYGQATALRRRQAAAGGVRMNDEGSTPLATLVAALCTRVRGLRRLRLSSLEPGDLTPDLLAVLRSHPQVVPHFHLPLQSGSDALLRRMNRQYGRDDFLRMLDRVRAAFDRPALTTDVIVGFPGETDAEFERTNEVVEAAGFIHVHAFGFSPRPGTAAARWQKDFVRGPVVNQRIGRLRTAADRHSLAFRQAFVGQTVELLVEREKGEDRKNGAGGEDAERAIGGRECRELGHVRHGRSERYFPVWFEDANAQPGDFARVRVDAVTPTRTHGTRVG